MNRRGLLALIPLPLITQDEDFKISGSFSTITYPKFKCKIHGPQESYWQNINNGIVRKVCIVCITDFLANACGELEIE